MDLNNSFRNGKFPLEELDDYLNEDMHLTAYFQHAKMKRKGISKSSILKNHKECHPVILNAFESIIPNG